MLHRLGHVDMDTIWHDTTSRHTTYSRNNIENRSIVSVSCLTCVFDTCMTWHGSTSKCPCFEGENCWVRYSLGVVYGREQKQKYIRWLGKLQCIIFPLGIFCGLGSLGGIIKGWLSRTWLFLKKCDVICIQEMKLRVLQSYTKKLQMEGTLID